MEKSKVVLDAKMFDDEERYCGINEKKPEEGKDVVVVEDVLCHIAKSTFDFGTEMNTKTRAIHSKIGYRERENAKNNHLIDSRNIKLKRKDEENIATLDSHGLFCCTSIDADKSKGRCTVGPFQSKNLLERHEQKCREGTEKHRFPSINAITQASINAITQASIDATTGKLGVSLACGAMPNRDRAVSSQYTIVQCKAMPDDIRRVPSYCTGTGCYRRDNKIWRKEQFRASTALNLDLEALFTEGENRSKEGNKINASKYTPADAVAVLKNMRDKDGQHRKYRKMGQMVHYT
jgi:hypothetical protein